MASVNPSDARRTFSWPQLLVFLGVAVGVGSAAAYFSYNGPLTSTAWRDWIILKCSSAPGNTDGAIFGPIKDVIRAVLALLLAIIGFTTLRIIPRTAADGGRALNWRPFSKPANPFEKNFAYEKWAIIAAVVLACLVIGVFRPLDFWSHSEVVKPAGLSYVDQVRALYTSVFAQVTRPYLFPYSLYVLALWCALALPVILAFLRSVFYDPVQFRQLLNRLNAQPGAAQPANVVATYERKSQDAFDFVGATARNYVVFLIGVLFLAYIQQDFLGCSVLSGAEDAGKLALLVFSLTSLAAVLVWYLRYYAELKATALAGIAAISDDLERDQNRDQDLHEANGLTESIRQRDGFKLLTTLFTGGGVVAIVFAVVWKYILGQNLCWAADGIFPSWMVNWVARLFQTHCA
ncbi:MAG TPA: hypothetical protein VIW73_09110 [Candidatus Cybelea sp.]